MNSPSVSILCKSAIEAVLLIGTMEFFNNSIQSKRICLKTDPFVFYFYLPYFAKICASPILS